MNKPSITVLMPAYNAERFIGKAIESILNQTYKDFEFLIINDGSTDATESIIQSYSDSRILYIKNDKNIGLIATLNTGINMANGEWIARMDSDDVALPQRLEYQKNYFDEHKETDVLATTIIFMNESGETTGTWSLDQKTINPNDIKSALIRENCIAHPTVMCRTSLLQKFRYRSNSLHIEDYDLWLRLLNRGYYFAKINTPLLYYRVHTESVTGTHLKKSNFFFRHAKTKWNVLIEEALHGKITITTIKIKLSMILDFIKGVGKAVKSTSRN
jgi:Glycosyltransferases involved in cell wall biogenesis